MRQSSCRHVSIYRSIYTSTHLHISTISIYLYIYLNTEGASTLYGLPTSQTAYRKGTHAPEFRCMVVSRCRGIGPPSGIPSPGLCFCWPPTTLSSNVSRAGFLSFPEPFSLRVSISRSTGISGIPLPVLLSNTCIYVHVYIYTYTWTLEARRLRTAFNMYDTLKHICTYIRYLDPDLYIHVCTHIHIYIDDMSIYVYIYIYTWTLRARRLLTAFPHPKQRTITTRQSSCIHVYIYIYIYVHPNAKGAQLKIWLYLDAEVLVLPPVFYPQDSCFVGRRLFKTTPPRSTV